MRLGEYLQTLTSLQSAHFQFHGGDFTDEALKTLCNDLQKLNSLKYLTLDLANGKKFNNKEMKALTDGLQKLKLLESLSLGFSGSVSK